MDLFDYAGELFKQNNELYVPGLGRFVKKRTSSYYNKGSLYPPSNKVSFEQNADKQNDELVNYFARQKKISTASAKYFVDKFVEQLRTQVNNGEVNFADLGTFATENGELIFKPKPVSPESDPAVFGLAPVKVAKLADREKQPILEAAELIQQNTQPENVISETTAPVASEQPAVPVPVPGPDLENRHIILNSATGKDQANSNNILIWTIFSVLAALIIAGFVWYYINHPNDRNDTGTAQTDLGYNPEKAKIKPAPASAADLDTATAKAALSDDSAAALASKKALATPPPAEIATPRSVVDTVLKAGWIVSGGQNNNYASAGRQVMRYRALGYPQAHMIDSVKKADYFVYKIVFGFYNTRAEAVAARRQLLKERKLKPKYITVQQLNKDK